jgi:hypothetical protein
LVLGVTGHRDLRQEDEQYLEAATREVLRDLRKRCPNTPLVLLSPLAEGADRLVARVALEEKVGLIVPMPLPLDVYEEDFHDETSRVVFRSLLDQAIRSFSLELRPGTSLEDVREPGPHRNSQYEAVGAYIVRNCLILIALWDGRASEAVGGTAQVLSFQRAGVPAAYSATDGDENPLDGADTGIVYQIVTPRVGKPDPTAKFTIKPLVPTRGWSSGRTEDEIKDTFDRIIGCIDGLNIDAQKVEVNEHPLVPEAPTELISGALQQLESDFGVADTLAIGYRNRANKVLTVLFILAFLAVVCFSVYAHWTKREWPFLVLYMVVVAGAYALYVYAGTIATPPAWFRAALGADLAWKIWRQRRDFKTRYLDYRALAEGIRVQFFWRLIGSQRRVADHYLRKQRGELDWIRAAIRGWTLLLADRESGVGPSPLAAAGVLEIVKHDWLRHQGDWFTRRSHQNREFAGLSRRVVHLLILSAVIGSVGLVWLGSPGPRPGFAPEADNLDTWREFAVVPLVLLSAAAALIEGFMDKTAVSEQAKQYERMSLLYQAALDALDRAQQGGDVARACQILEELGNEALAENGDWVMLHRGRPVEVQFES